MLVAGFYFEIFPLTTSPTTNLFWVTNRISKPQNATTPDHPEAIKLSPLLKPRFRYQHRLDRVLTCSGKD